MEETKKPDLFVLLGAGSSIGIGAPSTEQITKMVLGMELPELIHHSAEVRFDREGGIYPYPMGLPIMYQIERALRGTYKNYNFEHVVAALEELEPLCNIRTPRQDVFVPVLSGFTEFRREFEPINQYWIIQTLRRKVIQEICRCVIHNVHALLADQETTKNRELYKRFFQKLHEHFRLCVYTLNYDDYIDAVLTEVCGEMGYIDGFLSSSTVKAGVGFFKRHEMIGSVDPANSVLNKMVTLVHLHGSVRFGYQPLVDGEVSARPNELVQYSDAVDAFKSITNTTVNDETKNGTLIPSSPIISGFGKTEKLQERPVPFGYYLNTFVDRLLRSDRVLVVGYGGRDEYINSWLKEHRHVRSFTKSKSKISMINLLDGQTVGLRTSERDLIADLSSQKLKDAFFNPKDSSNRGKENWENGDTQVICSAFPSDERITNLIIEFLKEPCGANDA